MIVEVAVGAVEMDVTAMVEMVHHNLIHVGKNLIEMVVSDYTYPFLFSSYFNSEKIFPSTHVLVNMLLSGNRGFNGGNRYGGGGSFAGKGGRDNDGRASSAEDWTIPLPRNDRVENELFGNENY